ncbi:MAG: BamA/TamA family outer membrane protein [Elusimicrobiota bacterium]
MIRATALALCVLLPSSAGAEVLDAFDLSATRTRIPVLRDLLETRPGVEFTPQIWRQDIRRLEDTRLFYEIDASTAALNGKLRARLRAKNKFSTIPILKFKRGGGASVVTAGIYDVNLFRRLLEGGIQYESFNGKPGFTAWFRHPYFPSRRDRAGIDATAHTVNLPLLSPKAHREADFEHEEVRLNLRYTRELRSWASAGLDASIYRNVFRRDDSTAEKAARNDTFAAATPLSSGRTVSLTPRLRLGRLKRDGIQLRGFETEAEGEWSWTGLGSQYEFIRGNLTLRGGAVPLPRLNIAAQMMAGSKTGSEFQHKFYLGGLDSVRGFIDGQFRGNHVWLANLELRPTLLERPRWVVQGNLFTDWTKTWDSDRFGLEGFKHPFLSHGAGFRLILPRVYRAVLRVDIAWTRRPVKRTGFSMGLQQFF